MKKCNVDLKTIIDLLPISTFCMLCGIHRSYYYKLLKNNTKYDIFNKYCVVDKSVY